MSQIGRVTISVSMGGQAFSGSISRSGEGATTEVVALPAGVAGEISATGVDTLPGGHGIVTDDVIDVHWSDPTDGSHKCRRHYLVLTDGANDITFNEPQTPVADGDTLPANGTVCVVAVQVPVVTPFIGDQLYILAAKAGERAIIDFRTGDLVADSELAQKLVGGEPWFWASDQGVTNPLAGDDITKVMATNGSTNATTLYISALRDSVA